MNHKFVKKASRFITALTLMLVFVVGAPFAAAEARSYDWNDRIEGLQRGNASYTNKRPALTMIVQNFLSLYNKEWAKKLVNAGSMDGYFGQTTLECVKEYQSQGSLRSDGDVWSEIWWQIGYDLLDVGPVYGYFFFTRSDDYVLRALSTSLCTFYYPTFDYGDMQWNLLPKY